MSDLFDGIANATLDWMLPAGCKCELWSVVPALDGTGGTKLNNTSAPGYSAQTVVYSAASARKKASSADVTFGPATATWPEVLAATVESPTGTLLWRKVAKAPDDSTLTATDLVKKTPTLNDTYRIPSTKLYSTFPA